MFRIFLLLGAAVFFAINANAQDAAPPTVDLESPRQTEAPTPIPSPPADVPELSVLDQAFKQTSLGKAADEFRQRVEIRKMQNRVADDPKIIAAKRAADAARTDLEKRDRLREYYDLYYGSMEKLATDEGTRKALEEEKTEHLKLLAQPRVRPTGDATPEPETAKKKPHSKHSRR